MDLEAIPYFAHDLSHLEQFSSCRMREAKWEAHGFTRRGKIGIGNFETHIFVRGTTHT